MIFYLFCFALLAILGIILEHYFECKKTYIFICFAILSCIVGFRGLSIGNDTESYHIIINNALQYDNFWDNSTRIEDGFIYLVRLIGLFNTNSQFIIFVIGMLTILLFIISIYKRSKNMTFSILLLFVFGLFFDSMNITRQIMAGAILLLGLNFVKDKKFVKFAMVVLMASFIHKTAIVFMFIYFLNYIKFTKKTSIIFLAFCSFIIILFSFILKLFIIVFPGYSGYLDSSYFNGSGLLGILKVIIVYGVVLVMLIRTHLIEFNENEITCLDHSLSDDYIVNDYGKITILSLFTILFLLAIGMHANIADRLAKYFQIVLLIGLPNVFSLIEDKKIKLTLYSLTFGIFFVNLMINFIFRPEWNNVFPYIPFWGEL